MLWDSVPSPSHMLLGTGDSQSSPGLCVAWVASVLTGARVSRWLWLRVQVDDEESVSWSCSSCLLIICCESACCALLEAVAVVKLWLSSDFFMDGMSRLAIARLAC